MQRERSSLNSFPEPIDLNQGSLPDNTSMDHSASWNNMMNPVENRLSNYMLGGTDGNARSINAANDAARSFGGWDHGESSSSANHMQDGAFGGDSKTRHGWSSSSFNASSAHDARSEDWSLEPSNTNSGSYAGNQVNGRSLSSQNHSSNRGSLNLNLNHEHSWDHDFHRGPGIALPHDIYKSGHSEVEPIPTFYASSSNVGAFSASSTTTSENHEAPGSSFGTWGSSCKRKALEGTSGQFYPGGRSSSNQPMEKNMMQHPAPAPGCYSASGTLSISSGPVNLSPVEHLNRSSGVGVSRVGPGLFPSSSVPGVAESSARTFSTRSNHGRHDSVPPFDAPRSTSVRNSSAYPGQMSRPIVNAEPISLPASQPNTLNQINPPHLMHINEVRGTHSYPWDGSFGPRGGSSSSSFMVSGERGSGPHEDVNVRSSRRNNLEYPMTVSAPETRNVLQDQIDWSFDPGASASSRNHHSGSRVGSTAGGRTYSGPWLPHQIQALQNHQRSSESFHWTPSSRVDSEFGPRRGHFSHLSAASSLPEEVASTSRAQHQLDQRSAALLMDLPGDDVNGWRALAAVEGRHRLIRQVLNAMRRGVHLQAEDYMLIDPLINGFAELHDRHRDMRLDVDNMSYEELLALEERIGNVNTGLTEEKISGSMKQHMHEAVGVFPKMEPCCVCQEDYVSGDMIGTLNCGHEFHTNCIKQWLTLKNICPICKMTALKA